MAFNLFRRKKGKKKSHDKADETDEAAADEEYPSEEGEELSDEEIEKILEAEQEEPASPEDVSDTEAGEAAPDEPAEAAGDEAPPSPSTTGTEDVAPVGESLDSAEGTTLEEDIEAPETTAETLPDALPEEEDLSGDAGAEEAIDEDAEETPKKRKRGGLYAKLRKGLSKTRQVLTTDVDQLFRPGKALDEETLDYLEEMLITSDIGVKPATELIEKLSKAKADIGDADELREALKTQILPYIEDSAVQDPNLAASLTAKPHVIMVVGVNGVGKTTTIGKLAAHYKDAGKKVLIVAADTFRAAAIEQLDIWAERAGAEIVKHKDHSDPAAVAYDGMEAARARDIDVVIVDTAGRLHTKVNLMEELKKIRRTIEKKVPDAPHEVLLVLDATTGQNAISQTQMFTEAIGVTGFVLTKLDGTAKGGIVINLCHTFNIPLQFIGVGEQIDDLQVFDPEVFLDAML
ncbi:MAG: signal recognition particle-docking protein FtsY [Thermodesulfobacteriota bacterium]|nr:signal recognition particle-docking protein FtsY [Thermodesulfobacteriota bacterium]